VFIVAAELNVLLHNEKSVPCNLDSLTNSLQVFQPTVAMQRSPTDVMSPSVCLSVCDVCFDKKLNHAAFSEMYLNALRVWTGSSMTKYEEDPLEL